MSVVVSKTEGVTVFTLTSDPQSYCPPLCQILKGLCYSPACCSIAQHTKSVRRTSQSVLGALHIMVGLLSIGLAAIKSYVYFRHETFPFIFGGMFVFLGVMSILSEKCPSPCLVLLNVIFSVLGIALAIASIVLYSIDMADFHPWMCSNNQYSYYGTTPQYVSPREQTIMEKCLEGRDLIMLLIRSMIGVLVVLSALELCLAISSGVLGIKALWSSMKGGSKGVADPEHYRPLLEEVISTQTQPK